MWRPLDLRGLSGVEAEGLGSELCEGTLLATALTDGSGGDWSGAHGPGKSLNGSRHSRAMGTYSLLQPFNTRETE